MREVCFVHNLVLYFHAVFIKAEKGLWFTEFTEMLKLREPQSSPIHNGVRDRPKSLFFNLWQLLD